VRQTQCLFAFCILIAVVVVLTFSFCRFDFLFSYALLSLLICRTAPHSSSTSLLTVDCGFTVSSEPVACSPRCCRRLQLLPAAMVAFFQTGCWVVLVQIHWYIYQSTVSYCSILLTTTKNVLIMPTCYCFLHYFVPILVPEIQK